MAIGSNIVDEASTSTFNASSETTAQLQENGLEDEQNQIKFIPPTSVWSWIWKILIFVLIPAVFITVQLFVILYLEQYRTPVFILYFFYTQAAPVMESYKQYIEGQQADGSEQAEEAERRELNPTMSIATVSQLPTLPPQAGTSNTLLPQVLESQQAATSEQAEVAEQEELDPTTPMTTETQQTTSPPLDGTSNTFIPKKVSRILPGTNPGVPEISIAPQKSSLFWCFCYTMVLYMVVSFILYLVMLITIFHEVFLFGILVQDLIIFCPKLEKLVTTAKAGIKGIYSDVMKKLFNIETGDDEQGQSRNYEWCITVDVILVILSLILHDSGPQVLNYGVNLVYKICILAFKIKTFTEYKKMCYKEICKKHFKRRSRSGLLPSHVPPNPIDKSVATKSLSDVVNSDE